MNICMKEFISFVKLRQLFPYMAFVYQGSHGQGKVSEKQKKFKVREKSGNF